MLPNLHPVLNWILIESQLDICNASLLTNFPTIICVTQCDQSILLKMCLLYCSLAKNSRKLSLVPTVVIVVQLPSLVWLSMTPQATACQVALSPPSLEVCRSSCPLNWWGHPTISSFVALFPYYLQFPLIWCKILRSSIGPFGLVSSFLYFSYASERLNSLKTSQCGD